LLFILGKLSAINNPSISAVLAVYQFRDKIIADDIPSKIKHRQSSRSDLLSPFNNVW